MRISDWSSDVCSSDLSVAGQAQVANWKSMNSALFEALQVERVAMFVILSLIILVAVFNILSSLIMLVRAKTRDIAILRTMGASRRSLLKIFVTVGTTIGALGTIAGQIGRASCRERVCQYV